MIENAWDQIDLAVRQSRDLQRALERNAAAMAALLRGNLRYVQPSVLSDLKKELRDYNIHTRTWSQK